jgi:hypothetical protein
MSLQNTCLIHFTTASKQDFTRHIYGYLLYNNARVLPYAIANTACHAFGAFGREDACHCQSLRLDPRQFPMSSSRLPPYARTLITVRRPHPQSSAGISSCRGTPEHFPLHIPCIHTEYMRAVRRLRTYSPEFSCPPSKYFAPGQDVLAHGCPAAPVALIYYTELFPIFSGLA